MDMVCVGLSKNGDYTHIDLNTLTFFLSNMDMTGQFNQKKYLQNLKGRKNIYTVVGLVSRSFEYKSFLGYVVSNDRGEINIVKEEKLVSLLKKNYFMNYSLFSNDGVRYFPRKSPKVEVKEFLDKDIRNLLGYSFEDFSLSSDMNLDQIDFCMKNNGFKLGYQTVFMTEYYNKEMKTYHLIYFNKEGTQIILNYVDGIDKPLNYYHQTCVVMRDVDHKKYHRYLKDNPYNSCSSSPLVDTRNQNLDPNHTEMLFYSNKLERFLGISEKAKTYSKPIIPYSLGHDMYSLHNILNVTPYQDKKIREYGDKNWEKSSFMRQYMGYLNMLKYSDELKKYYSNCIKMLPKYFEEFGKNHNISDKDIKKMKVFIESLV